MPTQNHAYRHTAPAAAFYSLHPKPYTLKNFTFSAKERDTETGLSYFGSRYYSSDLSIWLSVDPQAAKYPSLSPYVYCANNPVKLVDPNGEELTEWDLDRKGNLTKRENGRTDIDIVHATNKNGKSVSRSYKANSINQKSQSFPGVLYKGTHEEIKYTSDYMTFSDIDVATDFFEFAAENTDVEWAIKSSATQSFVGTSHKESFVCIDSPQDMFLDIHSHIDKPSNQIGSDVNAAIESYKKGIEFKVYKSMG